MRRALLAAVALLGVGFCQPVDPHHVREGDVRFKVVCRYDHSAPDDPIVYPRQNNASHLHDFFGKRGVDENTTTYAQLVAGGATTTTCNDGEDRAAYWSPAAYLNTGVQVKPRSVGAYYRRNGKHGTIEAFPDGLKIVAGPGGDPRTGYQCDDTGYQVFASPPPKTCRDVNMTVRFPDCWDGARTDSADHRSHMAFSVDAGAANVCPSSHPVQVPQLSVFVNFRTPTGTRITRLSSGGPETLHADFFNGWVRARLVERVETCLNQMRRC